MTQHVSTAAINVNAPDENNNDGDRPWGITLITPDDPLVGISATPLIHFPNDAPILFVNNDGIPQVTLDEIKRLGDTGISRLNNVDVFAVGAAANPAGRLPTPTRVDSEARFVDSVRSETGRRGEAPCNSPLVVDSILPSQVPNRGSMCEAPRVL